MHKYDGAGPHPAKYPLRYYIGSRIQIVSGVDSPLDSSHSERLGLLNKVAAHDTIRRTKQARSKAADSSNQVGCSL